MPASLRLPGPVRARWERIPPSRRLPVAVFGSTLVVFLLWWAAYFPGALSYDSVAYVWQVSTGHWMGNHSVLYNSFVWLSLQICGDLWLLTLAQVFVYAAVLAYTCVALRDLGVRGRWSASAALVVAVLPATGSLAVWVWKDSAFSISALLAFAAAVRLLARRLTGRQGLRDRGFYRQMALLEAGFLGMALFRNNSILVVLLAFPFLCFGLSRMRRWLVGLTAATTVVYLMLQFVVYPAVGIVMPRADQVYAFNYADIAVTYGKAPQTFSKADLAVMKKVAPLSFWGGKAANCWDVDDTMAAPFNRTAADTYNSQLLQVWGRVVKRTPQFVAEAHLCRSQIAWGIFPGPADKQGETMISLPNTSANLFGWADWSSMKHSKYRSELKIRPLVTPLNTLANWWYHLSEAAQLQWLLWRGAFWVYLAYGVAVGWMWRRGQRAGLALAALPFGLQLSVIAANPAPLARYMVPTLYPGIFSLTLLPLVFGRHPLRPLPGAAAAPEGAGGVSLAPAGSHDAGPAAAAPAAGSGPVDAGPAAAGKAGGGSAEAGDRGAEADGADGDPEPPEPAPTH